MSGSEPTPAQSEASEETLAMKVVGWVLCVAFGIAFFWYPIWIVPIAVLAAIVLEFARDSSKDIDANELVTAKELAIGAIAFLGIAWIGWLYFDYPDGAFVDAIIPGPNTGFGFKFIFLAWFIAFTALTKFARVTLRGPFFID